MCGICGKLQLRSGASVEPSLLARMMDAISHRGPDGRGHYAAGPLGLGHTRLAILDLTSSGAQPMCNEDKTVWIAFNGEIYNYLSLREDLLKKGHVFSSGTDTEVILHLFEEKGVDCLQDLQGMFAFAIWDSKDQSLFLARDRVGIKPLYYTNTGTALVFASEIKALLADPEVTCEVNLQSIDKFLTHFCLPGEETLWKGIYKLEPGFYLTVKNGNFRKAQYWDLSFQPAKEWKSLDEAAEAVYALTKRTVREHMISDVPVGFLLSGGVDSTVILSCAASETSKKISTFTVGFDNAGFEDERPYARLAAKQFGAEHHEITFGPKEFWDFLPSLVWHMEEPICDPPAVSLHYVAKLARQHVAVLLSGEGGDEAFGGYYGYRKFLLLETAKAALRSLNGSVSGAIQAAGRILSSPTLTNVAPYFAADISSYYYSRVASPFSFFNQNKQEIYTADFKEAVSMEQSTQITRDLFNRVKGETLLNKMLYIDTKTSLPEDLLIKADRMTMGNSIELRVPFLDHELLQFAGGLPAHFKTTRTSTKRILKHAFRNSIPSEVLERKKAGFPLPLARWMRSDLKPAIRDVILSNGVLKRGHFRKCGIEKLLSMFDQGYGVGKEIFSLLTLEYLQQRFR